MRPEYWGTDKCFTLLPGEDRRQRRSGHIEMAVRNRSRATPSRSLRCGAIHFPSASVATTSEATSAVQSRSSPMVVDRSAVFIRAPSVPASRSICRCPTPVDTRPLC